MQQERNLRSLIERLEYPVHKRKVVDLTKMKTFNVSVAVLIRCLLCLNEDPETYKNVPFLKNSHIRSFEHNVNFVENNTTITINRNITTETCTTLRCKRGRTVVKFSSSEKLDTFATMRKLAKAHASVLLITSTIGIIGNGIVLATYLSNVRDMTAFRFLICHLAASDLLFAATQTLLVVPSFSKDQRLQDLLQQQQQEDISNAQQQQPKGKRGDKPKLMRSQRIQRIQSYKWPFGIPVCKFTRVSHLAGSLVAIGTILLMAVERYQGTIYPMRAGAVRHKKIKSGFAVGFIWITAITSTLPIWMVTNVVNGECEPDWVPSLGRNWMKSYHSFILTTFFLIPAKILLVLYGRIMRWLCQSQEIEATMSQEAAQKRKEKNWEIIKILLTVVILFYVCVLPMQVMQVILSFKDHTKLSRAAIWLLVYCGKSHIRFMLL